MIDYSKLHELLRANNTFVITTHVNPDGDAIGSVLALHRILKTMGKHARIINFSETPDFLRFLDTDSVIEKFDVSQHEEIIKTYDVFIAVDFNRPGRMVRMEPYFLGRQGISVCIDHHQDPDNRFTHIFCDIELCATGHLIYNLIEKTSLVEFTRELAEPLYTAIMTDTGSFRYERTTAEIHRIAARCLELGVVPHEIHEKIYDQNHPGKIKLLGNTLASLELYSEKGEIGVITLLKEDLISSGTREDDTDGFVNIVMSIANVKIGLKFIEVDHGFKVSLRSKGDIPVHEFAAKYGGGGHKNASGIRIRDKKLQDMRDEIISESIKFLANYEQTL